MSDLISSYPFYSEFDEYLRTKYPEEYGTFSEKEKILKYEIIFKLGLDQAKKYSELNKSCDLLINDKPPRADMITKLGHILFELEGLPNYPIVAPLRVSAAIKKILSSRDNRTIKTYLTWMQTLANYNREFNTMDLTHLHNIFPKTKIVPGGLW